MAEWVTVEPSLDPLLERIQPPIDAVDSVLGFLIDILNIVQAILNVVKVFLVGFLDPIRSLVEQIIAEIRALIQDLRQMGVYVTGDWTLLTPEDKFSKVLGGYTAYERRMLSRLLDASDPNRPNFSTSSAAVGIFLYVSSGDVNEVIRLINAILRFIGRRDLIKSSYVIPTTPEISYGFEGSATLQFRKLARAVQAGIPDLMSVKWSTPGGIGGITTAFHPSPKGFLIHVSTIQDGFTVLSLTAKAGSSAEVQNLPRVAAGAVDPVTNGPLKLYGGLADLAVSSDPEDFSLVEASDNAHAPLLVLQQDQNTPLIKPSTLLPEDGSEVPLVACTYFVKTNFFARLGAGTQFEALIPKSALPKKVSFEADSDGFAQVGGSTEADVFYVRVRAMSEDMVDAYEAGGLTGTLKSPANVFPGTARQYRFSYYALLNAINGVLLPELPGPDSGTDVQPAAITPASGPAVAQFPTASQAAYIQAVQAAVALVILTRADLTEGTEVAYSGAGDFCYNQFLKHQITGLEGVGRDFFTRYAINPAWFRGKRPEQFRIKMRWVLQMVASDLQARATPPDAVAEAVVSQAANLTTFMWSELNAEYPSLTILESLGIGEDLELTEESGIGANPFCRSLPEEVLTESYILGNGPERSPSFGQKRLTTSWVAGEGSADNSPIIYSDTTGRVEYVRNALLNDSLGTTVLAAAATVLQLAGASLSRPLGDTRWIAIRLLPQALVPLDQILERLDRFLQGVLDGLEGIIDKIVAYIEAIQARIYQLQALLNQIRALLRALDFFRLPSVSGLVVVASGTDGIVAELVASTNKPSDATTTYGAGVAIVAGGIPSVLLETLAIIFSGED